MEELLKKLKQLNDLIKAVKALNTVKQMGPTLPKLPTPKQPQLVPMTPPSSKAPKISAGVGPDAKKDPKKVAEQIKNGSMSTKTQKAMLKSNMQWTSEDIEKADEAAINKKYHIHEGPHRITSTPVTLEEVKNKYGSVRKLENSGFTLIPHTETDKLPASSTQK